MPCLRCLIGASLHLVRSIAAAAEQRRWLPVPSPLSRALTSQLHHQHGQQGRLVLAQKTMVMLSLVLLLLLHIVRHLLPQKARRRVQD